MKFTKRNLWVASALVGATTIAGCQRTGNIPPDVLDDTPIQVDAAMARRDWDETRATYANTGIKGPPTLYTFQSQQGLWDHQTAVTELPLFMTNVLLIPYQVFAAPIWREQEFRAATIPPSYSAMPPLPESNEQMQPAPTGVIDESQPMIEPTPAPESAPEPTERPADQPAPAPR